MKVQDVWRRPLVRRGLVGFVSFLVLLGLLGVASPYFLRPWLEDTLSAKLHRPVHVGELAINPFAMSATLKGVSVGEKDESGELAGFDELYVNLEASSMLHLAPVVNTLRVKAPRLHLVRLPDKSYNVTDLIEEFLSRPDEPSSRYALYNIQVSGARILFDDRPERRLQELRDLNLGIPFISNLPSKVDIYVQPTISGKLNGAAFSLGGKARPFAQTREAEIALTADDLDLTAWVDYIPARLRFKLPSARLDTRLSLTLLQPVGKPASLKLSGTAALRKLSLQGLDGRPILNLAAVRVSLKPVDILSGKAELESLVLESPDLQLTREKDGRLSVANLVVPLKAEGPAGDRAAGAAPESVQATKPSGKPGAKASGAGFSLALDHVAITGGKLALADRLPKEPVAVSLSGLDASADHVELLGGRLGGKADLSLAFQSLSIQGGGRKQPAFTLGSLEAKGQADGGAQLLTISELKADKGLLDVVREADGSLSVAHLLPGSGKLEEAASGKPGKSAGKSEKAKAPVAKAPAGGKGWNVTVAELSLTGWGARFEDGAIPTPLVVQSLSLKAGNLSTLSGGKSQLDLSAGLGKKGHLKAKGSVSLSDLSGALEVDLAGLDLVPLQGFFKDGYRLTLNQGKLQGKGRVEFGRGPDGQATGSFQGGLALLDLGLVDADNASDLLKWKALGFSGLKAAWGGKPALDLSLSRISLADFFARLVVNADGTLALKKIMNKEEAKGTAEGAQVAAADKAAAKPGAEAPQPQPAKVPATLADAKPGPVATKELPYRVRIGEVVLSRGKVRFSDFFIKPNYSANIADLSGKVTGLSSHAGTTATVALTGKVDGTAPLTVSGKVNPLSKELVLDITADARGVDMSGLSPYSARYAGYGIEKGKLSATIHYAIENRQLKAENHLFLDQLTFGPKVDSPTATHLPVLLAVALLKNSKGEIDINLPISGSLDDPQFSIGGIVVKMFLNLIVKAVTAPFALIGSLFGGGEELAWMEFDPGRAVILPAGEKKLQSLAKALGDRPALKLEVIGRADAATDTEGYKRALLERSVKAAKLKATVAKGASSGSLDEVSLNDEERTKYLTQVYKDAKFKKPKNFIGFSKSLPVPDMEKLLLENTEVTDDMLRRLATRRAKVVADWIVQTGGVPADRVFVAAPKLGADVAKEGEKASKASLARVDFVLK